MLKVSHLKRENEYLYVEGDTERIHYSVTDGNGFTQTLIVSRQVFKHTWEYITDTLQEYTIHFYSHSMQKNTLQFERKLHSRGWREEEVDEGSQKAQTSSYKINKY